MNSISFKLNSSVKRKRISSDAFLDTEDSDIANEKYLNDGERASAEAIKANYTLTTQEINDFKDRGCELMEDNKPNEALQQWQRAITLDPFNPSNAVLYELKAQVLLHQELYLEAVAACHQAVQLSPSWLPAHWTLARAHRELGEVTLSFHSYSRAYALMQEQKKTEMKEDLKREKEEERELERELREMGRMLESCGCAREKYRKQLEDSHSEDEREVARCFLNLTTRVSTFTTSPLSPSSPS